MRQEIPSQLGLESINPGAGVGGSRGWLETKWVSLELLHSD